MWVVQERDDLIQHLEKRPEGQWRSNTIWSFKNEDKVRTSELSVSHICILGCTCSIPWAQASAA